MLESLWLWISGAQFVQLLWQTHRPRPQAVESASCFQWLVALGTRQGEQPQTQIVGTFRLAIVINDGFSEQAHLQPELTDIDRP